jgi:cytoskeletal protein CcmA (bactofilin family)
MLKRKDFFGSSTPTTTTVEIMNTNDTWNRIMSGTTITGDLISNGNILIEGEVNGNISCGGKVHVGTSGKITGNLLCANAEFEGAQDGELKVENLLTLRSTARIKGNIETLKLHIEEGAYFEGACAMKSPVSKSASNQDFSFGG